MREIKELIWHTSATPEGKNFTVADIDRWHRERGWKGIGYHKVVYLDGSVHEGRSESEIGAHVRGRNTDTIGYCYIGGVDANNVKKAKDTRTPEQKATMLRLTKEAIAKYKLTKVSGHHDYAAKACPCFPARQEYAHLLPAPSVAAPQPLRHGDSGWRVKALQERLAEIGYPVWADSKFGNETRNALLAFQADAEIPIDGVAGPETMTALEEADALDPGARGMGGADELRARGSRIVKKADTIETTAKWSLGGMFGAKAASAGGLLASASAAVGQGQQAQSIFSAVQDLMRFASEHWFWLLIVVGGVVVWQMRGIKQARIEDHQTGKTT